MINTKVVLVILIFTMAQIAIWLQTYGQFKWPWLANNQWFLLLTAMPITYVFLLGTRMGMASFDSTWSLRFLVFSTGIVVFAACSTFILNEQITPKTVVSILLCLVIVCIQILWK